MNTIEQSQDLFVDLQPLDKELPSVSEKLSMFVEDKAKVFVEILANASFYLSKGNVVSEVYDKNLQAVKTALSVPSFIKGVMSLSENIAKGKLALKKTIVDVSFLIGDGVDAVKTLGTLTIYKTSKQALDVLGKVKNVTTLIGCGIQLKDGLSEAGKLVKIDPTKVDGSKVKDVNKAIEIKKRWVASELSAKNWDNIKNITGIAFSALTMTVGYLPWTFALLGTFGIATKVFNYMNKADSSYWNQQYVQILKS